MTSTVEKSINSLIKSYNENTSIRYKLLDSFLVALCISAVIEFLYALAINNSPYNAFLGRSVRDLRK